MMTIFDIMQMTKGGGESETLQTKTVDPAKTAQTVAPAEDEATSEDYESALAELGIV